MGAAKVLTMLMTIADIMPPYVSASSFSLYDKQVWSV